MKSTLLELPPEAQGLTDDSYVDAQSVEEIASRANLQDREVIERLLLPGTRFGDYQILGYIAAGGMGEVYAAERIMADGKRLGPVALKVISPAHHQDWAIAARFKREAQITRAIRSPHVIRVYEFGETGDGHAFLSMEMLNGEELFDRLCTQRSLPAEEVADLVLQILGGLRAVHESGCIHRDLKPENVYLHRQPDGVEIVKILDFGIAKRADEESDPYLSVVGKIYGTPEYIAPEQGLNPDVDARADLYAVGVLMYECLTGCLPFTGETPYAVILAHQNEPPPQLPSSVDPEFASIVHRALAKKAADRYPSAAEMADVIRAWLRRHRDDGLGRTYTGAEEGLEELDALLSSTSSGHERAELAMGGARNTPEGMGAVSMADLSGESDAPPVQIFSKPRRRGGESQGGASCPSADGRADARLDDLRPSDEPHVEVDATQERRAIGTGPRDEAPSSAAARMVTTLMVLAILVAAAWVLYDHLVADPVPQPEPNLLLD